MHLLQTTASSLDDSVEPLDLGQTPGDIVVLSFADSDLAGLAAAYAAEKHFCRACGSRIYAICAIRCRSICGSTSLPAMPR